MLAMKAKQIRKMPVGSFCARGLDVKSILKLVSLRAQMDPFPL